MRILQIAPHPRTASGIAAFARELREALRELGVSVEHLLAMPDRYRWREVRAFAAVALAESRQGYDAIHVELGGGMLHEFQAARAIAQAAHPPLFLTLHDPPHPVWTPFQTRLLRMRRTLRAGSELLRPIAGAWERALVGAAAGIFTLSLGGLAAVQEEFGPIRGAAIPYPARPRVLERPAGSGLTMGFFGHWYPGKGLEQLIRAVALTATDRSPITARLWGVSPDTASAYRDRVLRLIDGSGASSLIEVRGFLPDDRLPDELGSCDVFAFPYERRTGKRALMSASGALFDVISTGAPVVASDVRALAEFVEDGRNGLLVPPGDHLALAGAMRRLRDDPGLRIRLAAGARESALSRSPRRTAEAVSAHYARCLDHDPAVA